MTVFVLFQTDIHRTRASRVFFGVFTSEVLAIDHAKGNGLYTHDRYSGDMHPVIPAICTHLLNYHFDKVIFFFLNSHLLTRFYV
ncbi:MAG: hypothetical protein WC319_13940, partial [Candidatus Paceibacterota bacterium]